MTFFFFFNEYGVTLDDDCKFSCNELISYTLSLITWFEKVNLLKLRGLTKSLNRYVSKDSIDTGLTKSQSSQEL